MLQNSAYQFSKIYMSIYYDFYSPMLQNSAYQFLKEKN